MMQRLAPLIPENSRLHLGILNSVRAFDYAKAPNRLLTYVNTGGFGIDGTVSSLIGAAISSPNVEFFCVIGDLAFFYDINALCREDDIHNIHILVVNNDGGQQFRNTDHPASSMGKDVYPFVAAEGHNGHKSKDIIRHYAEDLGIRYFAASSKEDFDSVLPQFLEKGSSVILEAFTNDADENEAFVLLRTLMPVRRNVKTRIKTLILKHLKPGQIQKIKGFLGK